MKLNKPWYIFPFPLTLVQETLNHSGGAPTKRRFCQNYAFPTSRRKLMETQTQRYLFKFILLGYVRPCEQIVTVGTRFSPPTNNSTESRRKQNIWSNFIWLWWLWGLGGVCGGAGFRCRPILYLGSKLCLESCPGAAWPPPCIKDSSHQSNQTKPDAIWTFSIRPRWMEIEKWI